MSSEVKVLKLTTGEEIIAAVSEDGGKYVCESPMLVAVSNNQLVFIPYMQYTDAKDRFVIDAKHVMFDVYPVESILKDYQEATGKLLTPRARKIEVIR